MTEQEINRTIAELLGYVTPYELLPQDRAPQWATDTDAALALFVDMDKLPGFSVSLSYGSNLHGDKWYWHCHVYIADWLACTEKGNTAAEAACKAWVKFKGMETA